MKVEWPNHRTQLEGLNVSPYYLAKVYVGLGEKEKALAALEAAAQARSRWIAGLKADPIWDPLRSESRFQKDPDVDRPLAVKRILLRRSFRLERAEVSARLRILLGGNTADTCRISVS
jgi:hypothetical protein